MKKIVLIFILFFVNIYSVNACFTSVSFSNVHNRTNGHQNQCRPLGTYSGTGGAGCFSYSTSDSSIVTIGEENGKLCFYSKGHGRASATISVKASCMCNGKGISQTITFRLSEWGLHSLGLEENYKISPEFSDKSREYTVTVPGNQSEITIVATANDAGSKIVGLGKKTLEVGENEFTITVTTPEDAVTNYKLTVTREKPKEIEKIYFNMSNVEYNVNNTARINPIIEPSDAVNTNFTWKSSNHDVATVNKDGTIKTVGTGTAVITVETTNGLSASFNVKVTKKVSSIMLKESLIYVESNKKAKIEYDIYPEDATNKKVTFVSDNPAVVSVDENGNLTPHRNGTANITVATEDGNYSANCTVVVEADVHFNGGSSTGICNNKDMLSIIGIIKKVITILQIAIPIALILFGSIDMFKAVIAQDEKATKNAQDILIKRFIYAIVVFLVFMLVRLIMSLVGSNE